MWPEDGVDRDCSRIGGTHENGKGFNLRESSLTILSDHRYREIPYICYASRSYIAESRCQCPEAGKLWTGGRLAEVEEGKGQIKTGTTGVAQS